MHKIQQQILFFADQVNLKRDGLRQIGRLIGEPHPFKVSYHLKHLEENGFIKIDEKTGAIRCLKKETSRQGLFSAIPVIGRANCGVASVYAEQSLEGYIKISLVPTYIDTSPAATVETITLGTPTGSALMPGVTIEVPPLPPKEITPSNLPSA